jgi:hypothetical protein
MNFEALSLYALAIFAAIAMVQLVRDNDELRQLLRTVFRGLDNALFAVCKAILPHSLFNRAPRLKSKRRQIIK